jgi:hypothetical protein
LPGKVCNKIVKVKLLGNGKGKKEQVKKREKGKRFWESEG